MSFVVDFPEHFVFWVIYVGETFKHNYKGLIISFFIFLALIYLDQFILGSIYVIESFTALIFLVVNAIILSINVDDLILDAIIEDIKAFAHKGLKTVPFIQLVSYADIKNGLIAVQNCRGASRNPFIHLRDFIRILVGSPICVGMRYTYSTFGWAEPAMSFFYHGSANPAPTLSLNDVNKCHQQLETFSLITLSFQKTVCLFMGIGYVLMALYIIVVGFLVFANAPFYRMVRDAELFAYQIVRDFVIVGSEVGASFSKKQQ